MAVRLSAKGTKLQVGGDSSGAAYNDVAQVRSIGDLGGESGEIECTDLASLAKEFLMGLPDNGEVPVTLAFDPDTAGHVAFFTRQTTQEKIYHKVTLPNTNASEFKFQAYTKSFKLTGITPDGLIEAVATLRISGAITFTV